MDSIVIIFPYFGPLPPQYGMWRASALRNPTVEFMFFTDADVEPAENIIVHKMLFDDFRQIVQKAFDFPIVLDRPYKLCEYKQAYGYILQDYIKGYDFWGFGDLDLVYGDLRTFLDGEALSHKLLLGWGHLTLLHNDEDANTYFMKQADGYQWPTDPAVLEAIAYHNTGHAGMSRLAMCVCLADFMEPNRESYPLLEEVRRLAEHSLEQALLLSLEGTAEYVCSRGKYLHPRTQETIAWLKTLPGIHS